MNFTEAEKKAYDKGFEDGYRKASFDAKQHGVTNQIRCKECKFAVKTDDGYIKYCKKMVDDDGCLVELYLSGDHYCADAKRIFKNCGGHETDGVE